MQELGEGIGHLLGRGPESEERGRVHPEGIGGGLPKADLQEEIECCGVIPTNARDRVEEIEVTLRIPFNDLAQAGERLSGGGLHQFKDLWNLTAIRELRFLQLIPQDRRDICPVALFKALEPGALDLGEKEWNGIGTGVQDRSEIFRGTSRIKDGQADFQSGLPLGFSRVWLSQENKKANRGPHGERQGGADSTRENAPTWF